MAFFTRSLRLARSPLPLGGARFALAPRQAPLAARQSLWNLPQRANFSTSQAVFERKYSKSHEWIELSADRTTGTIGISEYAAEQLGDVVYVELPDPSGGPNADGWFNAGDPIGAVESVKSASDINAPVKCQIHQVNTALEEKPDTIGKVPEDDSYGGGWLAKVVLDDSSIAQLDSLMDSSEYEIFTASEPH